MDIETMGRVTVKAKIENLMDVYRAAGEELRPEAVRTVEVDDALVDTGATLLSMPKNLIDRLGLYPVRKRRVMTSAGPVTVQMWGTTRLTIQGRDCTTDVTELPDDCPVLIGQIPIEQLDFIIDLQGRKLTGNPAHGGEQMLEMY